ncbi:MAG: hypothetical protein FJ387_01615 [Verrucomicrobia bacterium]|nr:hypothetical protein [Verrucomicrobiota bacterium]
MKTARPTITITRRLRTAAVGMLLMGTAAQAGSFTSDFSNPNQPGFTLLGGVRPNNDPYPAILSDALGTYLALTFAENSQMGSIVLNPLDPAGTTIGSFKVSFKTLIGGGSSTPADGWSVYFGNGPIMAAPFGEEGPEGTDPGITVCFDTYDNGGGEAPAIDVKVNGVIVASKKVGFPDLLSDTFTPLNIELKPNGTLTVDIKGKVIHDNVVLAGYTPITDGQFAIGARTGGLNERNFIDDLSITTTAAPAPTAPTILVQPASQTVAEHGSVTFAVIPDGTPPFTFQWLKNNVDVPGATASTLTLSPASFGDNNAKFKARVTNALGNRTSDEATLTVTQDTVVPTISSARAAETFDRVLVTFSEPVNIATATFAINKGLTVTGRNQPTPTTVVLNTSVQTVGEVYTLTVNGVRDLAFVANVIATDTKVDFTAFVLSIGFLKHEYWGNIPNAPGTIDDLKNDARYQANTPDEVGYMSAFNTRTIFPNDTHEQYGARMSGFIIPKETAAYYFFIRSDDASQLFLSADATPPNPAVDWPIAEETGCCNAFQEPGGPLQTSWAIQLTAGQRYAVLALMKEGTGGDYCQVAWRKDTDTTPAGSLTPIPGEFLATYADPGVATINITQQPANATTTENKTASFTVAATGTPAPLAYQWQRAAPGSATFQDLAGARAASYTTPAVKQATDNGAKYRAALMVPGKTVYSDPATLTVDIDLTPPDLVRVAPGPDLKSFYVVFSEPVSATGAATAANYTVAGLTVTGARVHNSTTVMVVTTAQTEDTSYTVTVGAGVTDIAIPPNPVNPAANSGQFRSHIYLPGVLAWEIWTGLGGSVAVSALTGAATYPLDPNVVRLTPGYEGPSYGDNYGARLRGFITPKTTGSYVFYLAADDNAELWLSTDDSAANKARVAFEPVWANSREWTGSANRPCASGNPCENISQPISLVAGQRYYTEVLWKEGGGGDHAAVAWKLASAADPANGSPPIWGEVLGVAVPKGLPTTVALPLAVASPIGSADAAKPGFNARIYQVDPNNKATAELPNTVPRAEQELAGLVGPNVADLTGAVGGIFQVAGMINWNQEMQPLGNYTEIGSFQTTSNPSRPDEPIPGIPGLGVTTGRVTDNIAGELVTYVEFPAAGAYMMGVNSDDGFRVTATERPPANMGAVRIHPPSAAAGSYYYHNASTYYGGIFGPKPYPISGKLVLAIPKEACTSGSDFVIQNAAAVKGNVAFIYRGICTFTGKNQVAKDAGATASIIVNSRTPDSSDGAWTIGMGGSAVDIPSGMMMRPDGDKILAALEAGENITVDITPDNTPILGEYDGGRGAADTYFPIYVAQPGVYPLRLVWFEGGGGANLEWFAFDGAGNKILLNDRSITSGLKAYRARTFTPVQPTIQSIKREGANVTIEYTGVLQSATSVTGPWTDVTGTSPYTTATSAAPMKFWRSRQ